MGQARRFWDKLSGWSQATFGSDRVRGPMGPLKHLQKEVVEVMSKPEDLEEYVDLLFLVYDATRRAGFTFSELMYGARDKLEKNKAREWPVPTTDEPVEHVRTKEEAEKSQFRKVVDAVTYEDFRRVIDELADLHDKKSQDYGTGQDPFANINASFEMGIPPWVGCILRSNDKFVRIKSFLSKVTLSNESVEDSIRDIAVYMIICTILYKQEQKKNERVS